MVNKLMHSKLNLTNPNRNEIQNQPHPCNACARQGRKVSFGPCPGHGGGGGGSGGGEKSEDKKDSAKSTSRVSAHISTQIQTLSRDKMFSREVLAELIAKKILTIVDNKELGILSIKFIHADLLSNEQRLQLKSLIDLVEKELQKFMLTHDIAAKNVTLQKDYNKGLTISMLNHKHYDKFIRALFTNPNLLSLLKQQPPAVKQAVELRSNMRPNFPTPFSTKPKPKNWKD